MKKSVMLMASILAVALAGSAQAATMFAVQDSTGTQDMATISDTGDVAANKMTLRGNFESGLSKIPTGAIGTPIAAGAGVFHVASEGLSLPLGSFMVQHAAYPASRTPSVAWSGATASNFSFYRINKDDVLGTYSLPTANNSLGYFNFGTIDMSQDANAAASRKNIAQFFVKAEGTWSSIINTPTYFSWANAASGTVISEKMRLSSAGNLGIGTIAPTSKLHVVGLPVFTDNAAALAGGLTAGAIYTNGTGALFITF